MAFRSISLGGLERIFYLWYRKSMEPDTAHPSIGNILTSEEVAQIFRLDVRTVNAYYKAFGGVRIGRSFRFFENRIASMNDADFYCEKERLPEALERAGLDGREDGGGEMVRQHKGRTKSRNRLGRTDQKGVAASEKTGCGSTTPDPYGLLPKTDDP